MYVKIKINSGVRNKINFQGKLTYSNIIRALLLHWVKPLVNNLRIFSQLICAVIMSFRLSFYEGENLKLNLTCGLDEVRVYFINGQLNSI